MIFPYYTGERTASPEAPVRLPAGRLAAQTDPSGYLPDPGLRDAVNVALLLGQPLLLTGEPGSGKTQLAYSLAWELGFGRPLKFETKSTSSARDLFYAFDTLGRFHAAHTGEGSTRGVDYMTYNALGLAILYAAEEAAVRAYLPAGFVHPGRRRSVVLIDEVDKAPRDFPNDILNELEGMYFKIPELGHAEIRADPEMQPVVVITSNSEKNLPDAFLRRCIYYDVPFPEDRLPEIVAQRIGAFAGRTSPLLEEALAFFARLRRAGLRKRPATAELLQWLTALLETGLSPDASARETPERLRSTLNVLVKSAEDQKKARQELEGWLGTNGAAG